MSDPRKTPGEMLEHDHRSIDEHFDRFAAGLADGQHDAGAFRDGAQALRHHIWVEEEHHFPPLRAAGLLGPILVMLKEHGQIWDLLDELDSALDQGAPNDQVAQTYRALGEVLEAHNLKEERILYPAGDEVLDEEAAGIVLAAFTGGSAPQGWRPEMATRG